MQRVVALPAVFLAGFRAEEMPHVRLLIDKLGGTEVPVIPITSEMTKRKVKDILYEEEMDWSQPRPSNVLGGGDGSERCILFSGLDAGERATVVSELERQGLPRMGCSVVYMDDLTVSRGNLSLLACFLLLIRGRGERCAEGGWQPPWGGSGGAEELRTQRPKEQGSGSLHGRDMAPVDTCARSPPCLVKGEKGVIDAVPFIFGPLQCTTFCLTEIQLHNTEREHTLAFRLHSREEKYVSPYMPYL